MALKDGMGPQIPESEGLGAQGLDSYIPRKEGVRIPRRPGLKGKGTGSWDSAVLESRGWGADSWALKEEGI